MVDICVHACKHADCAMERGDVLPAFVERAWWPDGTEYTPRADALARQAQLNHARELMEIIERACSASTTAPDTSSPDSEPADR